MATKKWRPSQISTEALMLLKLASVLTGRDMRDLASEAITVFCNEVIQKSGNGDLATKRKK